MYSSTHSVTSALDGGGWSMPRPGRFIPRRQTQHPRYIRVGVLQGRPERVCKISPTPLFDPRTVQSVASRYTYYTLPVHCVNNCTAATILRLFAATLHNYTVPGIHMARC